jgi:hypothetical protein
MKIVKSLFFIFFLTLLFSAFARAQISSTDKFKMQDQFDKFKNQVRDNSERTMSYSQDVAQDEQVAAGQYQEKHEEATVVFDNLAKKSQRSGVQSAMHLYGLPLLILAAKGLILLLVWHQNLS